MDKSVKDFVETSMYVTDQLSIIQVNYDACVVIPWSELYNYDVDLACKLLDEPEQILLKLNNEVKIKADFLGVVGYNKSVQISNIPDSHTYKIRQVNHSQIGKLISVSGIVIQRSEVQQKITNISYLCTKCNTEIKVPQIGQFILPSPKCDNKECTGTMLINPDNSEYIRSQRITVQENYDDVPSGLIPQSFTAELNEELCDIESAKPGMRVTLIGVLCGEQRKKNDPDPVIKLYLQVNHIEDLEDNDIHIQLTDEDKKRFSEEAKRGDYTQRLIQSFAPQLYQLETEKHALLLQQCEGNSKTFYGVNIRGQIHILLCGDPGEGKSQMLSSAKNLHPRGVEATGKGGTAAGLTAAVIQDRDSKSWGLHAGAMVLADRGILCADELDKMNDNDRSAMHPAMEKQCIPINKAGINATLNTRCSVLAACNPKNGSWNEYIRLQDNINMPLPLIDRFGLIFILRNQRTINEEMERVKYISMLHNGTLPEPPYSLDVLRKMLAYARTFTPLLTDEAQSELEGYYRKMSILSKRVNGIPLSMRTYEDLMRLTIASAKLRFNTETSIRDAKTAINIMNDSLEQYSVDPETGVIDPAMLTTGVPKSLRDRLSRLVTLVDDLSKSSITGDMVSSDELASNLRKNWKMDDDKIGKLLSLAERDARLYKPRPGFWKVT